jgi:uncharacterized protein YuzE
MKITFDPTVDAMNLYKAQGEYHETLPLQLGGVDLNLDLDAEGRVLKLEVLAASQLFKLISEQGGELRVPERIDDPDVFGVHQLFPKAPTHV